MEDSQCAAAVRSLLPLAAQAAHASPLAVELRQQLQALLDERDVQQRGAAAAADAAAQEQQQEAEELQQQEDAAAATPLTKLAGRLARQQQQQQQGGSGLTPLGKGLGALGLATPPAKSKAGSPTGRRSPDEGAAELEAAAGSSAAAAAAAGAAGASLLSPVRQGLEKLGERAPLPGDL
jgi:hypothetical protein